MDHEQIWLEPKCCASGEGGSRVWCEDNVFTYCEADEKPTRYVRADIVDVYARQNTTLTERVSELESKLDGMQLQLDSWREAYRKLTAGDHAEVRLDSDGAIDEVVGSGVFHMEQMDTNRWFFDLAGCRFNIDGKKVTLTPIEVNTWAEEQRRMAGVR